MGRRKPTWIVLTAVSSWSDQATQPFESVEAYFRAVVAVPFA